MRADQWLTVAQAAEHAEVSERTIGRWIKAGDLPAIVAHPSKLVRLDHLQKCIRTSILKRRSGPKRHAPVT